LRKVRGIGSAFITGGGVTVAAPNLAAPPTDPLAVIHEELGADVPVGSFGLWLHEDSEGRTPRDLRRARATIASPSSTPAPGATPPPDRATPTLHPPPEPPLFDVPASASVPPSPATPASPVAIEPESTPELASTAVVPPSVSTPASDPALPASFPDWVPASVPASAPASTTGVTHVAVATSQTRPAVQAVSFEAVHCTQVPLVEQA